jgi:hypothetical protein
MITASYTALKYHRQHLSTAAAISRLRQLLISSNHRFRTEIQFSRKATVVFIVCNVHESSQGCCLIYVPHCTWNFSFPHLLALKMLMSIEFGCTCDAELLMHFNPRVQADSLCAIIYRTIQVVFCQMIENSDRHSLSLCDRFRLAMATHAPCCLALNSLYIYTFYI